MSTGLRQPDILVSVKQPPPDVIVSNIGGPGPPGPQGEQGEKGDQGDPGPQGPPGEGASEADEVGVDNTSWTKIVGTNVQEALDSIDPQLGSVAVTGDLDVPGEIHVHDDIVYERNGIGLKVDLFELVSRLEEKFPGEFEDIISNA